MHRCGVLLGCWVLLSVAAGCGGTAGGGAEGTSGGEASTGSTGSGESGGFDTGFLGSSSTTASMGSSSSSSSTSGGESSTGLGQDTDTDGLDVVPRQCDLDFFPAAEATCGVIDVGRCEDGALGDCDSKDAEDCVVESVLSGRTFEVIERKLGAGRTHHTLSFKTLDDGGVQRDRTMDDGTCTVVSDTEVRGAVELGDCSDWPCIRAALEGAPIETACGEDSDCT